MFKYPKEHVETAIIVIEDYLKFLDVIKTTGNPNDELTRKLLNLIEVVEQKISLTDLKNVLDTLKDGTLPVVFEILNRKG